MFPSIGDLHVAPFTDEALYMEQFQKANFWYQQSFHGVDLSALRDDAVSEYFKQPVVDTFGKFFKVILFFESNVAAKIGNDAFFDPEIFICPLSLFAPRTSSLCIFKL